MNKHPAARLRLCRQDGFTLTEVFMAAGASLVIGGASLALWSSSQQVWATGEAIVGSTDQARLGLERLTNDLRQGSISTLSLIGLPAEDVPLTVPAGAAAGATLGTLSFTGPNPAGGAFSTITYALVVEPGGPPYMLLTRTQGGPPQIVARMITSFQYDRPQGTTQGRTSLLGFAIVAQERASLFGGGTRLMTTTLNAQVTLRNG
jgi:hypothetical protein